MPHVIVNVIRDVKPFLNEVGYACFKLGLGIVVLCGFIFIFGFVAWAFTGDAFFPTQPWKVLLPAFAVLVIGIAAIIGGDRLRR